MPLKFIHMEMDFCRLLGTSTTKREKDEATVSGFRLEDQRWITGVVDGKERGCRWFKKLAVRIVDGLCSNNTRGVPGRLWCYLLVPAWSLATRNSVLRRHLYPAGQARENSFEEFKRRLLGTYDLEELTGWLIERFHALHQRESHTIEQYAQEVAEEAYLGIRLQEPTTLTEAQRLRRQSHTGYPKPEKTKLTQSIDAFILEVSNLSLKLERQMPTAVRPAGRRGGCFNPWSEAL
ncbi:hypothetical protein T02_12699 [Trichinella nativa]|uniref:Retrotransposon gag domain-containing protein n=1 Tax=Trichinella nativa TaxID=6335 RepID=A0A0V1KSR5_9BILA|nr:hypothetical protein T02_12699 [Trichinella nativa]